jgi:hypothetical protein
MGRHVSFSGQKSVFLGVVSVLRGEVWGLPDVFKPQITLHQDTVTQQAREKGAAIQVLQRLPDRHVDLPPHFLICPVSPSPDHAERSPHLLRMLCNRVCRHMGG